MARLFFARLLAPAVMAAGLGLAAMVPSQARADDLVRVIVDVADVIYHSGQPYYRYGPGYGYGDRLIVVRDRYQRPTYYRYAPRRVVYRAPPPRGNAYGYYRNPPAYVRYDDGDRGYYRHDRDRHDRDDRHGRNDRWNDNRGGRHDNNGHHRGGRGRD